MITYTIKPIPMQYIIYTEDYLGRRTEQIVQCTYPRRTSVYKRALERLNTLDVETIGYYPLN